MFCNNCGSEIPSNAKFCTGCGSAISQVLSDAQQNQDQYRYEQTQNQYQQNTYQQNTYQQNTNQQNAYQQNTYQPSYPYLVGFSQKINDPAFAKYRASSNSWSFIFSLILAAIALVAFPIYGNASGEIPWPQSLYYGAGIGGMFVVIALVQIIRRGADSTWDGFVVDKRYYERKRQVDNDSSVHRHYTEYIIKVKRDGGKTFKHKTIDLPGLYNYYNIGDKVRHHKGFYYYEKFDKSRDSQIMCAACITMNDINDNNCSRCKCPLLK